MFSKIGVTEILLVAVIVLLFFGGRKIPELMRGLGRGIKEFKDAANKDYSAAESKKPEQNKIDE
jgi:sec-independent protein translocase protein TatA